jgi:hypothetical protein
MKTRILLAMGASLLLWHVTGAAEIKIVIDHHRNEDATAEFQFKDVPRPAKNDAAASAQWTIVDGRRDNNGGDLDQLHDGKVPAGEDEPAANFFFGAGTEGGRLVADLGARLEIKQVNTYSWHAGARGPQVYQLFASDGKANGFNVRPGKGTDPEKCGWQRVARVDTRPRSNDAGGQYGVSISDTTGIIGAYQYLLFDIARTEADDPFGNTFFSEIDVIDRNAPAPEPVDTLTAKGGLEIVEAEGGQYQITIDTSETPDLTEWVRKELVPVVREWYPKLVRLLPSEGYQAPAKVRITFSKNMQGVAATGGSRIRCAAKWYRQNLKGEALGSVVHELVHVVQNYGLARRANPNAPRPPGWLVEGMTDYIRWYLYEPQSQGAEITKRNIARARYDGNYRITANFLNWVTAKYDKDLVRQLNAGIRDGQYSEELWPKLTGHTVPDLGSEWKAELDKKLGIDPETDSSPRQP